MSQKVAFNMLDKRTRDLMIEEILLAQKSGELYFSTRFNKIGIDSWSNWLISAASEYDEHWLAYQIESSNAMNHLETRAKPKGGYTESHVPDTAAQTMAEGQFNRFYIAAICRRAIEDGIPSVSIFRTKFRDTPRTDSLNLEGSSRDASSLLNEVRSKEMSLSCEILKPNSGLSVTYSQP